MSEYLVSSTDMTAIANAIRQKDGTQTTMTVSDMPTRIQNIPTGGGGTDYMAQRVQGTLSSYVIPNTCTKISSYAFASLPLTSITIPNTVTTISSSAFYNCKLTSVTIPSSVTNINGYCFSNNLLTSVTFDTNLYASFREGCFAENKNLTTLNNFSINIFKPEYSSATMPYIPISAFGYTALVGDISLGNAAKVGMNGFNNSYSTGMLYVHLTQTDITQLSSSYDFYKYSSYYSFNFDHCRLVVPYSADHSILTAYQTQWPTYSSIMIEENN